MAVVEAAAATAAIEVAVEVSVAAVPLKGRCCFIAVAEKDELITHSVGTFRI